MLNQQIKIYISWDERDLNQWNNDTALGVLILLFLVDERRRDDVADLL